MWIQQHVFFFNQYLAKDINSSELMCGLQASFYQKVARNDI